jgi:hypothetical protein
MRFDFNVLERRAQELRSAGKVRDAMRIYFLMADGDPSLDAGYLGMKIGECYEALGELYAAKYWYGQAIEQGFGAWPSAMEARERLEKIVNIDDVVSPGDYQIKD